MSFAPKRYQAEALEALRKFLEAARLRGADAAFKSAIRGDTVLGKQDYRAVQGLEDAPYVCLRLPTGGGKTYLAACSVKTVGRAFLEKKYPLVVWLVPSRIIADQTLKTLTTSGNPNREELYEAFGDQVRVVKMEDFADLRPQDIRDRACIVIGTFASSRVKETEIRKVYAHNENLEAHFAGIPSDLDGLEKHEDGPSKGKIKFSFINLLALHRPLAIVDEAHNAQSGLSFDVMRRMRPACILEFTATPAKDSNILYFVTAAELKKESMIKLPIMLTQLPTWQESIRDALLARKRIADLALNEPDFVRPLMLIQAEDMDCPVNVEVVEKYLVENERIERTRLAIATGNQRELDGVDLMKKDCQIEVVVTVKALKEGWDCPFAYIFCSVATVHSPKDVEQLLGRVLRMPYATERQHPDLNRAYAFVSNTAWPDAISQMHDRLVAMGFDPVEARRFVEEPPLPGMDASGGLPQHTLQVVSEESPVLFGIEEADLKKIQVIKEETGTYRVAVTGVISEHAEKALLASLSEKPRQALSEKLAARRVEINAVAKKVQATPFLVPQLCLRLDGELTPATHSVMLPPGSWKLSEFPAELTPEEFTVRETSDSYEIDVKEDHITMKHLGQQTVLPLNDVPSAWDQNRLAREIAKEIIQPFVRFPELLEFVRLIVRNLIERRGVQLTTLVRLIYPLEKVLLEKLNRCHEAAQERAYQRLLFTEDVPVETSFDYAFRFDPKNYAPHDYYRGPYQFPKHFYPGVVGAMDDEEIECAKAIEENSMVKRWVRNVPPNEDAFSIPRARGNFHPDFVAELVDERIFVIEYKGGHLLADAQQDKNIGERWEEKSNGRALFLMAVESDNFGRDVKRQVADKIEKSKAAAPAGLH